MEKLEAATGREEFDWRQYLEVARRRIWYFLVPFFFIWLAIWGGSWLLPPVYRSGTLILVEQPTVPPQYVIPNIASNLQDRLQSITQQILSRTRLLRIIDTLNLYADQRKHLSPDDLVAYMRKDITIELGHSDSDQLTSFNVYYASHDPHVAQKVTSELTNLFITENVEARQQQSENTTKFLETQLEQAREALSRQEDRVRRYKDEHSGALPTQLQSNLQILSGLQSQIQSEEDALNQAKQQNVYLQSLLQQYRAAESPQRGGGQLLTGLPAFDAELDGLRKQLAELRSRYTEMHPDVRRVKEEIARTEQMRQQMAEHLAANTADGSKAKAGRPPEVMEGRDAAAIGQLESQLKANQIEISNRQAAIQRMEERIGEYQARLNQAPIREEQLADLTRGYEQSRENYDSLLKKKNDSELATSLELQQKSEHFRILDPASLPTKPYFPNRRKMAAIALAAAIMAGIGAVVAAEFLDERLYEEEQVKQLAGVNVIGEIPPILIESETRAQRRELWARGIAATMVVAATLLGSGLSFFRG